MFKKKTDKQFENNDTLEINKVLIEDFESFPIVMDTTPRPTDDFINFTNYLDSIGYIADINRAKIVSHRALKKAKIDYYANKPFYKLIKKNSEIF